MLIGGLEGEMLICCGVWIVVCLVGGELFVVYILV